MFFWDFFYYCHVFKYVFLSGLLILVGSWIHQVFKIETPLFLEYKTKHYYIKVYNYIYIYIYTHTQELVVFCTSTNFSTTKFKFQKASPFSKIWLFALSSLQFNNKLESKREKAIIIFTSFQTFKLLFSPRIAMCYTAYCYGDYIWMPSIGLDQSMGTISAYSLTNETIISHKFGMVQ